MNIENTMASITEAVRPFYAKLDAWHDYNHGSRVFQLANLVNLKEGGDPFLVGAGAWLHQYHDNLDELKELLTSLRLSQQQRSRLFEIVEQCRPHKISARSSLEARIVFDGDALELVGPSGIFREMLCNVVGRRLSTAEAILSAKQVQALFMEKLQTQTARALAEPADGAAMLFWKEYARWEALLNNE